MITRQAVLAFLIPLLGAAAFGQSPRSVLPRVPEHPDSAGKYVFYLHGRIVEDQGPDAVSTEYGRYEYSAILQRLASEGFTVVSEARAANTDGEAYAGAVVQQIRKLIAAGVKPSDVTVIGASKGSVIAMLVQLGDRREVRLTTGLRHGFIYRPLEAWLKPPGREEVPRSNPRASPALVLLLAVATILLGEE